LTVDGIYCYGYFKSNFLRKGIMIYNSPVGICILDVGEKGSYANPSGTQIIGKGTIYFVNMRNRYEGEILNFLPHGRGTTYEFDCLTPQIKGN
jgi:hypothetical protein